MGIDMFRITCYYYKKISRVQDSPRLIRFLYKKRRLEKLILGLLHLRNIHSIIVIVCIDAAFPLPPQLNMKRSSN